MLCACPAFVVSIVCQTARTHRSWPSPWTTWQETEAIHSDERYSTEFRRTNMASLKPPEGEIMSRSDGDAVAAVSTTSTKLSKKEERGARLQQQVAQEKRERQEKSHAKNGNRQADRHPQQPEPTMSSSNTQKQQDESAASNGNGIVDAIGYCICCCGIFDNRNDKDTVRLCMVCAPCCRCCCGVSGANS